jgi:DNA ligase (NAD+)
MKKSEIIDILDKIKQANDAYYNLNESILTDAEYDALKARLINCPKKNLDQKIIKDIEDVLNQTGAPVILSNISKQVIHRYYMSSLEKVNSPTDFRTWVKDNVYKDFVLMDKIDGMSVELVYVRGILKEASTRGDGSIGESILSNVMCMQGVILQLPEKIDVVLRGEVVLTNENFEKVNNLLEERREKQYKSPRNTASGLSRRHDSSLAEYLTVILYWTDLMLPTVTQHINKLTSWGFMVPHMVTGNAINIMKEFSNLESSRESWPYQIDGAVISYNDMNFITDFWGNGNPKFAVAWKFQPLIKETVLRDIIWSVGPSGRVTPKALLIPVNLLGCEVTQASLSNVTNFRKLNLTKNCIVKVTRANDVIPQVLGKAKDSGGITFSVPTNCPICNTRLILESHFLYCTNDICKGGVVRKAKKWLDIAGVIDIGEATLDILYDIGKLRTPADLYKLTYNDLIVLDNFGDKKAKKIINNIQTSKEISLSNFLAGLNIEGFGETLAKILIDAGYDTVVKIAELDKDSLCNIRGISDITAERIIMGIRERSGLINDLAESGVSIKEGDTLEIKSSKLDGKSFCFTGAINKVLNNRRLTRDDMHNIVLQNGGTLKGVSKGLDYLVQADPSSISDKSTKAKVIGVEILSEEKFFEMIGD